MKCYVVIPCHNEAEFIGLTLDSLINQTIQPNTIVVVDDQSTDSSAQIVQSYIAQYPFIQLVQITSSPAHEPGSKVIQAFQKGLNTLDNDYDILCKFDADLIFPEDYMELVIDHFKTDPKLGMAGGFCYIQKGDDWVLENLTNKDHIRGALKAYKKTCFNQIGGLKPAMGWDTVDELLARYHGWHIHTNENLKVKHLKPTGNTYNPLTKHKQGEAFYRMRYGWLLAIIASTKLAVRKEKPIFLWNCLQGYYKSQKQKNTFLVTEEEGRFIRKLRWKGIKSKLGIA